MRRGLAIFITVALVIGVLVAINAASYVQVEKTRDTEFSADRSTFNSGPTGTRALYDFMRESGYEVMRWREPLETLFNSSGANKPATLAIIGRPLIQVEEEEAKVLLRWVQDGGRLVLIDREFNKDLLPVSENWSIKSRISQSPWDVDATDFDDMTRGVTPVTPVQPTVLTRDVEKVMPSRFAADLTMAAKVPDGKPVLPAYESATPEEYENSVPDDQAAVEDEKQLDQASPAPVVHFAREHGALVIDYPHGKGRIVLLADPYIVANNGINRADNLRLALNVVAGYGGLVAFDEYHQGHATTHNALFQYFSGTPILALAAQVGLLILLIVWSRGRRFARPLPLPHVDRRSSLEFVASMAELQQRARAYDLALENIYARVRRVLVRYAGASNNSTRADVARRVAMRSRVDRNDLEMLMKSCEDVINGAATSSRHSLHLARRLRAIEAALGLRMRSRETRQSEKN